uniref:Uncharacterized protein n=1 Tax=Zea mays TaxID=4577 RepID=C4J5B1_MAIZE|nr:unknown [Zea mays]
MAKHTCTGEPRANPAARVRDCHALAISTSNALHRCPACSRNRAFRCSMYSVEMSMARYCSRSSVGTGSAPTAAPGGFGIASRPQAGATRGAACPRAMSPTAAMNWAAPGPSATAWLNRNPTTNPPHANCVTWTRRMSESSGRRSDSG